MIDVPLIQRSVEASQAFQHATHVWRVTANWALWIESQEMTASRIHTAPPGGFSLERNIPR